jgi:hypothetical protein
MAMHPAAISVNSSRVPKLVNYNISVIRAVPEPIRISAAAPSRSQGFRTGLRVFTPAHHNCHEIGWRHNVDTATANSQLPASAFTVRSDWCADFAKAQPLVSNVSRDNNWRRFRIPSTVLKQRGVLWQMVEHQSLLVTERLTDRFASSSIRPITNLRAASKSAVSDADLLPMVFGTL